MPAVPWHICCILRRRALRHCCTLRPLAPLLWPTRREGPRPDPTTKRLQPSPAIPKTVCASCTALLLRHPFHSNTKASFCLPQMPCALFRVDPAPQPVPCLCRDTSLLRRNRPANEHRLPVRRVPSLERTARPPLPAFPDLPLKSEEEGKPGLPFLLSSTAVTVHHRRCLILSA